MYKANKYI